MKYSSIQMGFKLDNTIISSLLNYRSISIFLCAFAGSLFCWSLMSSSFVMQNIFTVIFITSIIVIFLFNTKNLSWEGSNGFVVILLQIITLHLSIAVTAKVLNAPDSFFWVTDSYSTHLPESIKYSEYFKGNPIPLSEKIKSWKDIASFRTPQGTFTHMVTGLFMAIFGVNTFSSILVQLLFKLVALYCIFSTAKLLWSEREGVIAAQLYAFCPTVFFYNLMLYKESAVQMLTASIFLMVLLIYQQRKWWALFPLILAFVLLSKERFYVSIIMSFVLILPICKILPRARKVRIGVIGGMFLVLIGLLIVFNQEVTDLWVKNFNWVKIYKSRYASFSDVLNNYNYQIPYPLAFIKILFSPYFTLNKFSIFSHWSLLIIWGSFINQAIILASVGGFLGTLRKRNHVHIILWLPFICFLIFAAYISPWSGRLRDSFYPLIACYGAFFLVNNKHFIKVLDKTASNGRK
jgi:hypothetical protein